MEDLPDDIGLLALFAQADAQFTALRVTLVRASADLLCEKAGGHALNRLCNLLVPYR
jgi:hypothetical protein